VSARAEHGTTSRQRNWSSTPCALQDTHTEGGMN